MKDLLHQDDVRNLVRDAYRGIDTPAGAGTVLYGDADLAALPDGAQEWSLGVGNPVRWAQLQPGEDVVDVGSGGGIDTMLAARAVGPGGRVTGVDLLPEMVERARRHAAQAGLANCRFVEGQMEALPLADDSADVLVSNGVVNLSPRKTRALLEFHRVVRSAGRISLADIVVDTDLPTEIMTHPSAWAGWVAGAMAERDFAEKLDRAGFVDIDVVERRSWSIDDCRRYPLFSAELIALMRRLLPSAQHDSVASVLTFTARKP